MNKTPFRWVSALTLAATLSLPTLLLAQDTKPAVPAEGSKRPERPPGGPGGGAAQRPQRDSWLKEIGASDEQIAKVREATKDQADKARELRQDTKLSPEERRTKMRELRDSMVAKLKTILTPEQFAKYEKMREENRGQGGPGRRGPGGPGRGAPEGGSPGGKPSKGSADKAD